MTAHEIATIYSLASTVPALLGSLGVIWLWKNAALDAWRRTHRTETHWLVMGVVFGFIGSMADNAYWAVVWLAEYYAHPIREPLFKLGVYPNSVFRQTFTALAALCHIRAAVKTDSNTFRLWILVPWALGLVVAVLLYLTR